MFFSSLFFWGCSENSLTFQVRFSEVSGLKKNDQIYLGRNEIGQVKKVTYTDQGDYLVEVKIAPEFKNAATESSMFYIGYAPSSEPAIAVLVEQERPGGAILKNGAIVRGSVRTGYLDKIFEDLQKSAGKVERDLNKALEDLKRSLGATSETLNRNLETAIDDLSHRLDAFKDELGRVPDSQEIRQLEESFRRFADEFLKAQKEVQDHIRTEILPRFRLELEHLREQLKKEGRDKEMEKLEQQVKELEMV